MSLLQRITAPFFFCFFFVQCKGTRFNINFTSLVLTYLFISISDSSTIFEPSICFLFWCSLPGDYSNKLGIKNKKAFPSTWERSLSWIYVSFRFVMFHLHLEESLSILCRISNPWPSMPLFFLLASNGLLLNEIRIARFAFFHWLENVYSDRVRENDEGIFVLSEIFLYEENSKIKRFMNEIDIWVKLRLVYVFPAPKNDGLHHNRLDYVLLHGQKSHFLIARENSLLFSKTKSSQNLHHSQYHA